MKFLLLPAVLLIVTVVLGAPDSAHSGVYRFGEAAIQKRSNGESRNLMKGDTRFVNLSVHSSTLAAGFINHPPVSYTDKEELIIVTGGALTVMINDSLKVLEAGGIIFIAAGDTQSFKNSGAVPASYHVITFKTGGGLQQNLLPGSGSYFSDWKDLVVKKTAKGFSRPVFEKQTGLFARLEVHLTSLDAKMVSHLPHQHLPEEIMVVIKGAGIGFIAGNAHPVAPGDIMFMESGVLHAFENTGDSACTYVAIQWQH